MRKKDEKLHEERKALILDKALDCFIQNGIHGTSIQQICSASNLSPGQMYRFFGSKDEIIEGLAEREQRDTSEFIEYLQENSKNVKSAIFNVMRDLITLLTDKTYALAALEFSAESSRNESVAKHFRGGELRLVKAIETAIEESRKSGTVDKKIDPKSTAFLIMAMMDGIAFRSATLDKVDKKSIEKAFKQALEGLLS